jgi:hypothetical protein
VTLCHSKDRKTSLLSLVHGPALAGPFLLLARKEEAGRDGNQPSQGGSCEHFRRSAVWTHLMLLLSGRDPTLPARLMSPSSSTEGVWSLYLSPCPRSAGSVFWSGLRIAAQHHPVGGLARQEKAGREARPIRLRICGYGIQIMPRRTPPSASVPTNPSQPLASS